MRTKKVMLFLWSALQCGYAMGAADEDTALSHSDFTAPIRLKLGRDGFAEARQLAAMNGVDNAPIYGARYATRRYLPCVGRLEYQGNPDVDAYINGYSINPNSLARWLFGNRIIEVQTYKLRYANASMGQSYGSEDTYACPIINENVSKYLSNQSRNVHNGVDLVIGRRIFARWTFRNRYDTPIPGKGNVKVFAGTFTYRVDPTIPIVAFQGEGTASVKVFLDPDNGRWTIDSWKKQDPGISLLTSPLQSSNTQQPALTIIGRAGQLPLQDEKCGPARSGRPTECRVSAQCAIIEPEPGTDGLYFCMTGVADAKQELQQGRTVYRVCGRDSGFTIRYQLLSKCGAPL